MADYVPVLGKEFALKVLEALGVPSDLVWSVTVSGSVDGAANVTIERRLDKDECDKVVALMFEKKPMCVDEGR
jgi:hypothetical protein